jgi:hypothetical protein
MMKNYGSEACCAIFHVDNMNGVFHGAGPSAWVI